MYQDTIQQLAETGAHKASKARLAPFAYFIGAMMAGAYIGFGDILMFSVSSHVDPAYARLIAGAVFASALTIVIFAGADLFFKVAHAKMSGAPLELFAKGVLCNWLVCLAVWMVARTNSDSTQLAMIFWPIFAFVAGGFEHSVANMFVFSLALLGPHPDTITLAGAIHNLVFVTLGNLVGGSVFMAFGYWAQQNDGKPHPKPTGKPVVR
ncbi:formate/nitrite transporter family protein [Cupriavidus plantarum]|uniref:formate/nitrite transporter family protein n=1 Tax=Cupriavidus plantarum TaxID=942865 RepID=UPI000E223AD2|nr:formate/nitrite transporter family protein [Cupriavidus plantarum]REE91813.1 formate/nitrite transporter [Cupriavidus plantarum]